MRKQGRRRGKGAKPFESVSETAGGIPDDAIGPGQASVPEQLDLAGSEAAEAMLEKLRAEAEARVGLRPPQAKPNGLWEH